MLITNMEEDAQATKVDKLAVDSHGLIFPIHKKHASDDDDEQLPQNKRLNELNGLSEDDNRPISGLYGDDLSFGDQDQAAMMCASKMLERLNRRLGRCNKRYAEETAKLMDAVTDGLHFQIASEQSTLEFLLSHYHESIPEEVEHLVNRSTFKVLKELEQGKPMNDQWEKQVEELELRLKLAKGRNEVEAALFNRQQLKQLTKAKQAEAEEFSLRMQELAKEKAMKREADINSREFTLMVDAREEAEARYKEKLARLSKQHEKAMDSLRQLQERKKVRHKDFVEGLGRYKKANIVTPVYVQKGQEFKKMEEDRYYSHGRPLDEVEEFLKQKKTYHLLRNKKSIMELLHPERTPSAVPGKSIFLKGRLVSAQENSASSQSQNRKLNNSYDLLQIDESNIKFAKLPKIKFSK